MRLLSSFFWAGRGALWFFQRERNARIQLAIAEVAFFADILLGMPRLLTLFLVLACGGVLGTEAMNAALERVVDLVTEEYSPLAGEAKDLAAGAVLLVSASALAVGLMLFWPERLRLWSRLMSSPVWADLALTAAVMLTLAARGRKRRPFTHRDKPQTER